MMKNATVAAVTLALLTAAPAAVSAATPDARREAVMLRAPSGEQQYIGPGPGCFGTAIAVQEVRVPRDEMAVFYSGYGCTRQVLYTGGSHLFHDPVQLHSVLVISRKPTGGMRNREP